MLLIRYVKKEQRVMKFTESVQLLSGHHLCVYSHEHGACCSCGGRVSWKRSKDKI